MDWLHIDTWLSSLYDKVPYFEKNNQNYALLNHLLQLNLLSTKLVENYITNHHPIITTHKLSTSQRALNSLALIAESLGIRTTELSNYITALTSVSITKMDLELEETKLNDIEFSLSESHNSCILELDNVKGILTKLQDHKRNQMTQELSSFDGLKTSEYLSLEQEYKTLQIERKGNRLTNLIELDSKARQMELQLKQETDKLNSYQVLPPDKVLATIKIGELQDELHELEVERESSFSELIF